MCSFNNATSTKNLYSVDDNRVIINTDFVVERWEEIVVVAYLKILSLEGTEYNHDTAQYE